MNERDTLVRVTRDRLDGRGPVTLSAFEEASVYGVSATPSTSRVDFLLVALFALVAVAVGVLLGYACDPTR